MIALAVLAFPVGVAAGFFAHWAWREYRLRRLHRCFWCHGAGCYRVLTGSAIPKVTTEERGEGPQ